MHPAALLDTAARLVALVLKFEHPADAVVARFFRDHRALGPRERRTLAETAFAVLRRKLLYESLARSGQGPRERRLAILAFPGPRDFVKAALSPDERRWLDDRDAVPDGDLMAPQRHNLPPWLAERLKAEVGHEFDALAASLLEPAPLDLRVNIFKAKREDVRRELADAGIDAAITPFSPWGLRVTDKVAISSLPAFKEGRIEVQDEGSQLLALLVDARRGEMVADFCAGAGGKTLALGAAMRSTGRLYAFDTSAHRLDALAPRLARSGLSNVHPVAIAHERDYRVRRLAGKLDRVLVDAPCSGLGTLRRHPDLKWRQTVESVAASTEQQLAILHSAASLLKPGGRLVYATCSLLKQENEAICLQFTSSNSDFSLTKPNVGVDSDGVKGVGVASDAATSQFGETLDVLRLWPHRHGTDGYFAAVWDRRQ